MIVAPWGIWQSSDHRLTDPTTGKLVDDYSMKHISLSCPDGSALITYTGIGRVKSTDISDWLRGTLRGRGRSLDDSFIAIRELATKWVSPIAARKHHLFFNIGAFLGGNAWVVQIGNNQLTPDWRNLPPTSDFHTSAKRIENQPMVVISGAREAVTDADIQLLGNVSQRKPRRPQDFRKLLAAVNERAAHAAGPRGPISSACVTAYMPPAGEPIESETHGGDGGTYRPVPVIFRGIDLTDWDRVLGEMSTEFFATGKVADKDGFDRRLEQAGRQGVQTDERFH